ncbi:hypothetical protein GKE82_10745 [Conexibacter sp. W3-3-2]|uniref:hypothetical protein n=1 Tax=Conexibacter sp. W3-3-2 TaxID=2675227 RepID=UPI0012B90496|nr:hypothetical protein [Conexibacter sp. W3-3-2]MTD44754.1 hypothetical protein [Conexibacter sp. W3-3-2]
MTGPCTYLPLEGHPQVGPQDVLDLWVGEGALDAAQAQARLPEVLHVAVTSAGELAAVCTVHLHEDPQLRADLWFYRTYVGVRHRRSTVAEGLLRTTVELLEARWQDGRDRRGAGIAFRLQNDGLRAAHREAVWPRIPMSYVTRSPGGELRVRWFAGALAPDPPRAT